MKTVSNTPCLSPPPEVPGRDIVEAEFDEGVVDRIQNHTATGSRPSIVSAVYNKAHKLDARSKAVQAWADMVTGSTGNVIPFSRRSVL